MSAENPASSKRAFVAVPQGYFQMDDDQAADHDEAIADELMRQLGIADE